MMSEMNRNIMAFQQGIMPGMDDIDTDDEDDVDHQQQYASSRAMDQDGASANGTTTHPPTHHTTQDHHRTTPPILPRQEQLGRVWRNIVGHAGKEAGKGGLLGNTTRALIEAGGRD